MGFRRLTAVSDPYKVGRSGARVYGNVQAVTQTPTPDQTAIRVATIAGSGTSARTFRIAGGTGLSSLQASVITATLNGEEITGAFTTNAPSGTSQNIILPTGTTLVIDDEVVFKYSFFTTRTIPAVTTAQYNTGHQGVNVNPNNELTSTGGFNVEY